MTIVSSMSKDQQLLDLFRDHLRQQNEIMKQNANALQGIEKTMGSVSELLNGVNENVKQLRSDRKVLFFLIVIVGIIAVGEKLGAVLLKIVGGI